MPHADSSLLPDSIQTKAHFWAFVLLQLEGLLEGQRNWVTNLANASSLIYSSLQAFPRYFGKDESKAVNWCGFYIDAQFFPVPRNGAKSNGTGRLLLGPFCGKPACQFITVIPEKARGVCADAFLQKRTLLVPEVDVYPGHIACDGDTKSEIVCPLFLREGDMEIGLGVLDLDCLAVNGFDEDDRQGLEKIAAYIVRACDW
ncbi:GAF domain-like protein [Pluteus cervinus]|uniref:GAF domain-like protein n=1 Tax=Pluteus cervinus TaxID=181527 RepID=A0ACD3AZ50_9AGAR|nr:GAF domain-like protein [Pluteus cervinus]